MVRQSWSYIALTVLQIHEPQLCGKKNCLTKIYSKTRWPNHVRSLSKKFDRFLYKRQMLVFSLFSNRSRWMFFFLWTPEHLLWQLAPKQSQWDHWIIINYNWAAIVWNHTHMYSQLVWFREGSDSAKQLVTALWILQLDFHFNWNLM